MSRPKAESSATPLSALTDFIQYGYTAKSSSSAKGPKYLRITDIQDDHVEWTTVPRVSIASKDLARYRLEPGDIVFARSGATVGKSFLIQTDPGNAVFASYLIRVRCTSGCLDPRYAALYFKSEDYWQQIRDGATGTGQPNFNGSKLGELRVPKRPLNEQLEMVGLLEGLLKRSKNAHDELVRIPRLVERYKEAVLAAAFRGDTTAKWRTANRTVCPTPLIEPATRLTRKREGGNTTESSIRFPLPKTWKWASVESIGEVILGRQRSPENHTGPNMRPYIRAANITWHGWDLSDVKQMNFDERDFKRFRLQPGDVLINEGSGSADEVGKPAIWNGEIKNCCFQNTLIAIRPYGMTPEYLYFVLLNAARSKAFVDETRGVNIHHIGRAGLAQFVVPVPPTEEQQEIVRRIKSAFAGIEKLQAETSRATDLIERLDRATLAKAFRGELAPLQPSAQT
jgi:type I restriction enzyme, S subunit